MSDDPSLDDVRRALDAADGQEPVAALPHLREAADRLTALIDATLAVAVLRDGISLRHAGAQAGLSENAVGPRLARTRQLGGYADERGRVTAAGVERARYDQESGTPRPTPERATPMRFKPRRPTS